MRVQMVPTKTRIEWVIRTFRLLELAVAVVFNSKTISSSKTKFVKVWMASTERALKRWSFLKTDKPLRVGKPVKRGSQSWEPISSSKWVRAWKRRPAWKSFLKAVSIRASRQKAIMQRRLQRAMTTNSKTQASSAGSQAISTQNKAKVKLMFKRLTWIRKKQRRKAKRPWMEQVVPRVLIGPKLSMNMLLELARILSLSNQRLRQ